MSTLELVPCQMGSCPLWRWYPANCVAESQMVRSGASSSQRRIGALAAPISGADAHRHVGGPKPIAETWRCSDGRVAVLSEGHPVFARGFEGKPK